MGCGGSRTDALEPRYLESWTKETESTWLTSTDTDIPLSSIQSIPSDASEAGFASDKTISPGETGRAEWAGQSRVGGSTVHLGASRRNLVFNARPWRHYPLHYVFPFLAPTPQFCHVVLYGPGLAPGVSSPFLVTATSKRSVTFIIPFHLSSLK